MPHFLAMMVRAPRAVDLVDDLVADPQRPVPDRARVLCPTHRQQLGQQGRDLAEGDQRGIPGRDVRELWRDRILAQVQDREALRLTRALTGADEQPADPDRHVAEQGAKPRPIIVAACTYLRSGTTLSA